MTEESTAKLLRALNTSLEGKKAKVWVENLKEINTIHVEPLNPQISKQYLQCTFWIDQSQTCSVAMGKGCHFDVPEAYTIEGIEYLTLLSSAGVGGYAKEVIVEKNGEIVSSSIELTINGQTEKHNYRKGLITLGGTRTAISYSPYKGTGARGRFS